MIFFVLQWNIPAYIFYWLTILKKTFRRHEKNCSPPWCHIHDTTLRYQCHRRVRLSKVNDTVECDSAVSKINIFKTVLPIILGVQMSLTKKRKTGETTVWNCIFLSWRKKPLKNGRIFFFTLRCCYNFKLLILTPLFQFYY